eukprot:76597-Amphidinium_carterae.1
MATEVWGYEYDYACVCVCRQHGFYPGNVDCAKDTHTHTRIVQESSFLGGARIIEEYPLVPAWDEKGASSAICGQPHSVVDNDALGLLVQVDSRFTSWKRLGQAVLFGILVVGHEATEGKRKTGRKVPGAYYRGDVAISACVQHLYSFCRMAKDGPLRFWNSCAREARILAALLPLYTQYLPSPEVHKHGRDLYALARKSTLDPFFDPDSALPTLFEQNPDPYEPSPDFKEVPAKFLLQEEWRTKLSRPFMHQDHIGSLEMRAIQRRDSKNRNVTILGWLGSRKMGREFRDHASCYAQDCLLVSGYRDKVHRVHTQMDTVRTEPC